MSTDTFDNAEDRYRPSRLELVHATTFTLAVMLAIAGVFGRPLLLLISGPCFLLTALLIWLDVQIRLSGVIGRVLRAALGPSRLMSVRLRALTWVVVGIALTTWGYALWTHPRVPTEEPPPIPAHLS